MAEDESKNKESEQAEEGAAVEAAPTEAELALAEEAQKAKKKTLRLFIILTIANVCFLSWLVYTMRYQTKAPKVDTYESHHQSDSEPEEAVDSDDVGIEALSDAIAIDPFLVNVIARHKGKARQGQKVLRVKFEVIPETEGTASALEKHMPKIRDSINILLSSQDYTDLSLSQGREALRNLIKEQINEVIHPEKIIKVYFIEFVIN